MKKTRVSGTKRTFLSASADLRVPDEKVSGTGKNQSPVLVRICEFRKVFSFWNTKSFWYKFVFSLIFQNNNSLKVLIWDLLCIIAYYLMLCPLGRASSIFPFLTTFLFRKLNLSGAEQGYVLLDYFYSQTNTMSMGPIGRRSPCHLHCMRSVIIDDSFLIGWQIVIQYL